MEKKVTHNVIELAAIPSGTVGGSALEDDELIHEACILGKASVVHMPMPSTVFLKRIQSVHDPVMHEKLTHAMRLEEIPGRLHEAEALYVEIIKECKDAAAACINLGTIRYNQRRLREALALYQQAVDIDPKYALAWFDLGNVQDELQMLEQAIASYQKAIDLSPNYADAHYNLALSFIRVKLPALALRHWQRYVELDPDGPWSLHARTEMRKIVHSVGQTGFGLVMKKNA